MTPTTHELKDGDLTVFLAPEEGKVVWLAHENDQFHEAPEAFTHTIEDKRSFAAPMVMVDVKGSTEDEAKANLAARCAELAKLVEDAAAEFLAGPVEMHEWVKDEHHFPIKEDDSDTIAYHHAGRIYTLFAHTGPETKLITTEMLRMMVKAQEESDG